MPSVSTSHVLATRSAALPYRRPAYVVVALVALALTACTDGPSRSSAGSPGDGADVGPAAADGAIVERAVDYGRPAFASDVGGIAADGTLMDAAAFAAAMNGSGLSEAQAEAVRDGTVTFAEVEGLLETALTCMREAGLDARAQPGTVDAWSDVPSVSYIFSGEPAGLTDDQAFAVEARCATVHLSIARDVYELQNAPPEEEIQAAIDAAFSTYRACLEGAGIADLPEIQDTGGNYDVYLQYASTIPECPTP